jgi:DNA-binding NarL/FixJ family response regulator
MNMEGLTVAEIAQILSIPEGTVRTRLSRKGIKPITNSPVYDKSAVEAIRNVKPKGWPRKKPGESSPPRQ